LSPAIWPASFVAWNIKMKETEMYNPRCITQQHTSPKIYTPVFASRWNMPAR
jgi:hypothetical protein